MNAAQVPHTTASKRRAKSRHAAFPPTRKQLLDVAKLDALLAAFGSQSGAQHSDCGSLPSPERWFCIQTHPGQERRAAFELRQQRFTVFLPMGVAERHRRLVARPELSRYLFVSFDPAVTSWRPICHTFGVARLFMFGDFRPAPARRGDVERLIDMVLEQLGTPDPINPGVPIGSQGRVAAGPLDGFRCVVVGEETEGRVRVAVELFGRPSTIVLERDGFRADGS